MSTYFISDLHLSSERPESVAALNAVLSGPARSADALYVLGDLFDAWVGDDILNVDSFAQAIAAQFRSLADSGVPVYFQPGNRDFLLGEAFARSTGGTIIPDLHVIDLHGKRTVLTHGDLLCTSDSEYQEFRTTVRSTAWKREFLSRPIGERIALVATLRERSRRSVANNAVDVDSDAVEFAFRNHGAQRLIHGHTHKPAKHQYMIDGRHCERFVLADWFATASVLELDQKDGIIRDSGYPEPEFVALIDVGGKLKVASITSDGKYRFLDQGQHLHSILYVTSSETETLRIAIEELESLINDANCKEASIQDFFERYPEFILDERYKKAHPHVTLAQDDEGPLIPDFMLEPLDQSTFCDLLELKLPSARIFVGRDNRKRYSAKVMEAISQLRAYRKFFDEDRNRQAVKERFGLRSYKPRMIVVIGRKGTINPLFARDIEIEHPSVELRTYDEIVDRMKSRVDAMTYGRHMF